MRGFLDDDDEDTEIGTIIPGPGVTGSSRPGGVSELETAAGSLGAGHGSEPGTRELDDLVMDVLEDAVADVWEYFLDDEQWYEMRYIPLSLVESLLKAEVERSGVRVSESVVKKAAADIWESL